MPTGVFRIIKNYFSSNVLNALQILTSTYEEHNFCLACKCSLSGQGAQERSTHMHTVTFSQHLQAILLCSLKYLHLRRTMSTTEEGIRQNGARLVVRSSFLHSLRNLIHKRPRDCFFGQRHTMHAGLRGASDVSKA